MKYHALLLSTLTVLSASCGSTPEKSEPLPRPTDTELGEWEASVWNDPAFRKQLIDAFVEGVRDESEPGEAAGAALEEADLSDTEALVWSGSAFRRHLIETFLAEGGTTAAVPIEAAAFQTAFQTGAPRWQPWGTGSDLSIWTDPDFRRRFVESYIAETDIEPRVSIDERDVMREILDLISAEDFDGATLKLQEEGGPAASAVFDFTLANIHFQRENLEPAAAAYEVAVQKHPKFKRAWRNLGLIRVRQSDFPRAAEALSRVLELGGADGVTYGLLGYSYSNMGNELSAESAYRMASLLEPETLDWKMGLARSFFQQEQYGAAASLCGNLIEANPDSADLWLLQANAFVGMNEPMRAAENFELVDRLGKSTADSLNMLGDIYINEELFDVAVTSYVRALEMDPEGSPARIIRAAKVLTAQGAYSETVELVTRIEELVGEGLATEEKKDLLKLRARVAVAEGAGEEEARVLEEIVELDPLDGEALILLGQHAERSGAPEKAVFYYERATGLEDFEADASVRHAQLLVRQNKYVEALPLLRRAQAVDPRENVQEYLDRVERAAQGR